MCCFAQLRGMVACQVLCHVSMHAESSKDVTGCIAVFCNQGQGAINNSIIPSCMCAKHMGNCRVKVQWAASSQSSPARAPSLSCPGKLSWRDSPALVQRWRQPAWQAVELAAAAAAGPGAAVVQEGAGSNHLQASPVA
jgi:hypothetical protein